MSERCRNRRGLQNVFRGLSLESRFAYFVSMASYTTQQKGIFRKTKGNASLHQRRKSQENLSRKTRSWVFLFPQLTFAIAHFSFFFPRLIFGFRLSHCKLDFPVSRIKLSREFQRNSMSRDLPRISILRFVGRRLDHFKCALWGGAKTEFLFKLKVCFYASYLYFNGLIG